MVLGSKTVASDREDYTSKHREKGKEEKKTGGDLFIA
jgi:hypothetical protein